MRKFFMRAAFTIDKIQYSYYEIRASALSIKDKFERAKRNLWEILIFVSIMVFMILFVLFSIYSEYRSNKTIEYIFIFQVILYVIVIIVAIKQHKLIKLYVNKIKKIEIAIDNNTQLRTLSDNELLLSYDVAKEVHYENISCIIKELYNRNIILEPGTKEMYLLNNIKAICEIFTVGHLDFTDNAICFKPLNYYYDTEIINLDCVRAKEDDKGKYQTLDIADNKRVRKLVVKRIDYDSISTLMNKSE